MRRSLIVVALIVLVGCGGGGTGSGPAPTTVARQVIASGLNQPMQYIASTANPRQAYILERPGLVRVVVDDALQPNPVVDLTGQVVTDGECGLQGMVLAPDFATSHLFYLQFNTNEGGTLKTRVERFTMSGDGLSAGGATPIFIVDQPFSNHKGGTIQFRDGHLYVALGDGGSGNDPDNHAQDPQSLLGKILRLDPTADDFPADPDNNYHVPSDNPFVGVSGTRGEIWAFGLRNPFRWSVDSTTGAFVIADVGQDSFEEVNYEPAGNGGRNYGWRIREGLHPTANGGPAYPGTMTDPILEYDHGTGRSIIGGYVVRANALGLINRYLFADYVTDRMWSIDLGSGGSTSLSAATELGVGGGWSGIVSINPDANGSPVIVELNSGEVSRLVASP